jgi:hypothetical protein
MPVQRALNTISLDAQRLLDSFVPRGDADPWYSILLKIQELHRALLTRS